MQRKCWWDSGRVGPRCSVRGCVKEARFLCAVHPEDGYFCNRHRSEHTAMVDRRNAELDSRPREDAEKSSFEEFIEDLPEVMKRDVIREGAGFV